MKYFFWFLIAYSIVHSAVSSITITGFIIFVLVSIFVIILFIIANKYDKEKAKKKYGEFPSLKSRKKTDLKNNNIERTSIDRTPEDRTPAKNIIVEKSNKEIVSAKTSSPEIKKYKLTRKHGELPSFTYQKETDIKNTNIDKTPIDETVEKNIVIEKLNKETVSEKTSISVIKKYRNALQKANRSIEKLQSEKVHKDIALKKIRKSEIKKYEDVLYKANDLIEKLQSEVTEKDIIIKKLNKNKNHTIAPKKIILNNKSIQRKSQEKDNGIIVERESFEDF